MPEFPDPQAAPGILNAPAAIRYNNPGAQWPARESPNYGMTGYGIIGGGNQIAQFPTPEHGAAANMDLLSRRYVGMTIGDAAKKWSNSGYSGVEGFKPDTVITPEMVRNPDFAVPFFKSISKVEAGKPYPMSDEQWQKAHAMFLAGGADSNSAAPPSAAPPSSAPISPASPPPPVMGGGAAADAPSPGILNGATPDNSPANNPNIQALVAKAQQMMAPQQQQPEQPSSLRIPIPKGLPRAQLIAALRGNPVA